MLRALLVDDHQVVREGISAVLKSDACIAEVLWAENAEACRRILEQEQVDFVLLDINLPDQSGLELCKELKLKYPSLPIIVLSTFSQPGIVSRMIKNGANGYVLKSASTEELNQAISAVFRGEIYYSQEVSETVKEYEKSSSIKTPVFTRREREVLKYIAEGLTNGEIAEKLFISQLTVISHRKSLVEKTGSKNTAQLVKYCFENGYL